MKIVQGNCRQYQLAEKTRKKDIDGVRYLVAGERNLWVKLLKDKSAAKREEIYGLIIRNGSTGFEKPLELVADEKGRFVGYTFYGPEMDIVPEKKQETVSSSGGGNINYPGISNQPVGNSPTMITGTSMSGMTQILILVVAGIVMFLLMKNLLNRYLLLFIYENISQVAGEGCARLSFDGILPGVVGIVALILFYRRRGKNINTVPIYCIMAVLNFAAGALITYVVMGLGCVLIISVFGVIKTNQSVIFTVLIVAGLIFLSALKDKF